MNKEYMGINAVCDLFDIIDENYVSREDLEKEKKKITGSINAGSALIAASILKAAEVIATAKGGEGGEEVSEDKIATDSEVDEVLGKYFGGSGSTETIQSATDKTDESIATDEEVDNLLSKYF